MQGYLARSSVAPRRGTQGQVPGQVPSLVIDTIVGSWPGPDRISWSSWPNRPQKHFGRQIGPIWADITQLDTNLSFWLDEINDRSKPCMHFGTSCWTRKQIKFKGNMIEMTGVEAKLVLHMSPVSHTAKFSFANQTHMRGHQCCVTLSLQLRFFKSNPHMRTTMTKWIAHSSTLPFV